IRDKLVTGVQTCALPISSTLTKILLHITFSTKNRAALIPEAVEPDLYAYIGGICRPMESPLLAMGGTVDHVHMMVSLGKTVALRSEERRVGKRGGYVGVA